MGFKTALGITGQYPPLFLQVALADFIGEGFFATHLRRMRRLYARRQRDFVADLSGAPRALAEVGEIDTGMQVVGRFKRPMDDGEVLAAARGTASTSPACRPVPLRAAGARNVPWLRRCER